MLLGWKSALMFAEKCENLSLICLQACYFFISAKFLDIQVSWLCDPQ